MLLLYYTDLGVHHDDRYPNEMCLRIMPVHCGSQLSLAERWKALL
jgi:hypothetical protein